MSKKVLIQANPHEKERHQGRALYTYVFRHQGPCARASRGRRGGRSSRWRPRQRPQPQTVRTISRRLNRWTTSLSRGNGQLSSPRAPPLCAPPSSPPPPTTIAFVWCGKTQKLAENGRGDRDGFIRAAERRGATSAVRSSIRKWINDKLNGD